MRAALPLASLGLVLLLTAGPAWAFHESYFKAEGVAAQGSTLLLATVEYIPIGGESLTGTIHVQLREALGGAVVDTSFPGVLSQSGFDNDPIPEMFVRTLASTDGGTAFSVTGAIFQWEQTPTVFVHAYQGHYQGYTLAMAALQVGGNWV